MTITELTRKPSKDSQNNIYYPPIDGVSLGSTEHPYVIEISGHEKICIRVKRDCQKAVFSISPGMMVIKSVNLRVNPNASINVIKPGYFEMSLLGGQVVSGVHTIDKP